jgi:uncharacterized membrane protein
MRIVRPSHSGDPSILNKVGVALLYIVLGWFVLKTGPMNALSILMLVGILSWALFLRHTSIKYFIRYHAVQAILLNLAIAIMLVLLITLLDLLLAIPGIDVIGGLLVTVIQQPMNIGGFISASAIDIVVMTIALAMGFYCFRGEYAQLPYITDGVRHWVRY